MSTANVWSRFTKNRHREELKFRMQELSRDDYDKVFDMMFTYFVPEEPFCKASKITEREEAFEEHKQGLRMISKDTEYQIDVCCVDDDSEDLQLVGASIMVLEKKEENSNALNELESMKEMAQAEEIKKFFSLISIICDACNVMEKYNLDSYYDDRGIVVHPDYRGLGIATELFKTRALVCKERGVPMTGAWMTSLASQKAAAQLGWETICELEYKDLGQRVGVEFVGGPPSCKLMVIRV